MSNDERFHELTHKALSNEATLEEQRELGALIAEKPELKEELEQMSTEVAAVREILPLLEDIQHPRPDIPRAPAQRLQREIREVFESRAESPRELRELLARLETWAGRQIGAQRERVVELISTLRTSFSASAPGPEQVMVKASAPQPASLFAARFGRMRGMEEDESRKRAAAEFEKRLRSLEDRLSQAEDITRECREEIRHLIEAFARNQQAWAERTRTGSSKPGQTRE